MPFPKKQPEIEQKVLANLETQAPGSHPREISEVTGLGDRTVRMTLKRLVGRGKVVVHHEKKVVPTFNPGRGGLGVTQSSTTVREVRYILKTRTTFDG